MSMSTAALDRAVDCIRRGGLLAYPTETVWGLGVDARSDDALAALQRFKGRAGDAPVSILVAAAKDLDEFVANGVRAARDLAERFWPGPLTLVVPCPVPFARGVAGSSGGVGFRCSSHPTAQALTHAFSEAGVGPVTSTSLNRSGELPARTRSEAASVRGVDGEAAAVVEPCEDAGGQEPSTVIDLCGERPRVLRWGALASSTLAPVLEEISAA